MKDEIYWKLFEKTGNIFDYLNYACTSEESLNASRTILEDKKVGSVERSGDSNGNGVISNAHWGI